MSSIAWFFGSIALLMGVLILVHWRRHRRSPLSTPATRNDPHHFPDAKPDMVAVTYISNPM